MAHKSRFWKISAVLGPIPLPCSKAGALGIIPRTAQVKTLIPDDATALSEQPYVDGVSPSVNSSVTGRFKEIEASTTVNGVSEDFFYVKGMNFESGQPFDKESSDRTSSGCGD